MSELEFDLLDELYFVQPFTYIQKTLKLEEAQLKEGLFLLFQKGWIKCYNSDHTEVLNPNEEDFQKNYKSYHYLASKEGLLKHNSR